ncbi:MAG: NAD(P)H-quinone oxidoreductase subunit 2, chloroplastic [bacterium]|nr:NAD(P)H-quinone oxidoreductase subunit 2, chloroplastic [bacterium]
MATQPSALKNPFSAEAGEGGIKGLLPFLPWFVLAILAAARWDLVVDFYQIFIDNPLEIMAETYTAYFLLVHEFAIAVGALMVLILDMIRPVGYRRKAPIITLCTNFISWGLVWYTQYQVSRYFNPAIGQYWGGQETIDPFSLFLKSVALIAAIYSTLLSMRSALPVNYMGEFYFLLEMNVLAMTFVVSSSDLLAMFVLTEFVSLASYIMVSVRKDQPRSIEAGMKYFLFGSLTSAFMLLGILFLYGMTGTTNLYVMKDTLHHAFGPGGTPEPIYFLAVTCLMVGMGFKLAMAPFHLWAADAYEGAPIPVVQFIAVAPKVTTAAILIRILLLGLSNLAPIWVPTLLAMAATSMVVGNLFAMRQSNIKRFLAFSGVAQMGYMMMGMAAAGHVAYYNTNGAVNSMGYQSVLNYFIYYTFMLCGMLTIANIVEWHTGHDTFHGWKGLGRRAPASALTATVCLLALAGIPPTGGFIAKFYVFAAAMSEGLYWIVILGAVMAVIASFYYLNLIRVMWVEPVPEGEVQFFQPDFLHRMLMIPPFAVLLFTFVPIPIIGGTLAQYLYNYAGGSTFLTFNIYFGTSPSPGM